MRIQKKISVSRKYNVFRFIVQVCQKEGGSGDRADVSDPRRLYLRCACRVELCVLLRCAALDGRWEIRRVAWVIQKPKGKKKPRTLMTEVMRARPNSTLRLSTVPSLPFSCLPSRTTRVRAYRAVWDVPRGLSIAYEETLSIRGEGYMRDLR